MGALELCGLKDTIVYVTLNKNKKPKAVAHSGLTILAKLRGLDLGV